MTQLQALWVPCPFLYQTVMHAHRLRLNARYSFEIDKVRLLNTHPCVIHRPETILSMHHSKVIFYSLAQEDSDKHQQKNCLRHMKLPLSRRTQEIQGSE